MNKQWWNKEYQSGKNLPSSRTDKPSRSLVWFVENYPLSSTNSRPTAWDVGCGIGRNSFYLAQNGYQVVATEISDVALEIARTKSQELGLSDHITFIQQAADDPLDFPVSSFNLVIDMMVLHLLSQPERLAYTSEVQRLLKAGGHYLAYTIFAGSPAAEDLFQHHPGPEPHSYFIPQSGVFEKTFTHQEFQGLFPTLAPVVIENKTEFSQAFGDKYERMYIHALLQKQNSK